MSIAATVTSPSLYAADVDPCEAHVLRLAVSGVDRATIAPYRGWDDDDWAAAAARLAERGWLDDEMRITPVGADAHAAIEADTDRMAEGPTRALGEDGLVELLGIMRPLAWPRSDTGTIPFPNPIGVPRADTRLIVDSVDVPRGAIMRPWPRFPSAHDDLEAILSQVAVDDGSTTHTIDSEFDTTFTWNYAKGERPALDKLYEKAKTSQWNGATDLDWSIEVDPERTANELSRNDRRMQYVRGLVDEPGSPVAQLG